MENIEIEVLDSIFDCESQDLFDLSSATNSKRRKKKIQFTLYEKKKLSGLMKNYPAIWDLQNPQHFNSLCLSRAWSDIAKTLNKTVEDCKVAWKAIRDSRRYYLNTNRKKNSGSSGGEVLETPELNNNGPDWELSEELSYLPNVAKKRTTLTSAHFGTNSDSTNSSNYTYTVKEKKKTNQSNNDMDYMKSTIDKIVDTCTTLSTSTISSTETDELAPFLQIMKNKLQQLPAAEAENLCMKFIGDINTAINNNK